MLEVISNWVDRYFSEEEAIFLLFLIFAGIVTLAALGRYLAPFIAAAIFAFMLQGLVNRLMSLGVPRLAAVCGAFLVFLGLGLGGLIILIPLIGRQATNLIGQIPGMIRSFQGSLQELPQQYPQMFSEEDVQGIIDYASREGASFAETLLSQSVSIVPGLAAMLIYLFLMPLLVFFMLKDKDHLLATISGLLPSNRPAMKQVGVEMNQQIANYVRGKALEILIIGIASFIWFLFLGVDYAVLLAVLVGLSVLVPYIGVTVVTLPVALVGYFQWGWGPDFMWLMVAYGVIQILDGNVLAPLLFSEVVNLHPVLILLAVLVFGGIWGFWGVFFAIPLATLVKALYNAWPGIKPQEVVLGEETDALSE